MCRPRLSLLVAMPRVHLLSRPWLSVLLSTSRLRLLLAKPAMHHRLLLRPSLCLLAIPICAHCRLPKPALKHAVWLIEVWRRLLAALDLCHLLGLSLVLCLRLVLSLCDLLQGFFECRHLST